MPAAPKAVPLPTTTVISVLETMVHDAASVPDAGALPIFAALHVCDDGTKFDPVTVTVEPTYAEEGLTLPKMGFPVTVNTLLADANVTLLGLLIAI